METTGKIPTEISCYVCTIPLTPGENWTAGNVKKKLRVCAPCATNKSREWYRNNRDRARERNRVYYHEQGGRERAMELNAQRRKPRSRRVVSKSVDHPGYVYVLKHPAFGGRSKVGYALNLEKRLTSYQVGCPNRAYQYVAVWKTAHRYRDETVAHTALQGFRIAGTEWFRIDPEDAVSVLTPHLGNPLPKGDS